jgi:cyclophilin family peptidyl-prolyl cis-trans isomerase
MKKYLLIIATLIATTRIFAQKKDHLVTLTTSKGLAHMVLFDETPLHKANFLKLVKESYYDSLIFHRVIEKFMIQGGDPDSKNAKPGDRLGSGGGNLEKIPYEFTPMRVHKKGALAAASNGNPEKMSNPVQFYIVHGRKHADEEISNFEKTNGIKYTNKQRADYMTVGGYPSLDNRYTVFGEVIDNLKLIDEIAAVQIDQYNRPVIDIKMAMTVKKMRKKKITRLYGYNFIK